MTEALKKGYLRCFIISENYHAIVSFIIIVIPKHVWRSLS